MSARVLRRIVRAAALAALVATVLSAAGCAARNVGVYDRERLVDPIMAFKAEAKRDQRRTRALEAREGSTGGNGGEGGGCACK